MMISDHDPLVSTNDVALITVLVSVCLAISLALIWLICGCCPQEEKKEDKAADDAAAKESRAPAAAKNGETSPEPAENGTSKSVRDGKSKTSEPGQEKSAISVSQMKTAKEAESRSVNSKSPRRKNAVQPQADTAQHTAESIKSDIIEYTPPPLVRKSRIPIDIDPPPVPASFFDVEKSEQGSIVSSGSDREVLKRLQHKLGSDNRKPPMPLVALESKDASLPTFPRKLVRAKSVKPVDKSKPDIVFKWRPLKKTGDNAPPRTKSGSLRNQPILPPRIVQQDQGAGYPETAGAKGENAGVATSPESSRNSIVLGKPGLSGTLSVKSVSAVEHEDSRGVGSLKRYDPNLN